MSMVDVILLGSLAALGWVDLRKKRIPVLPVVLAGNGLFLYRLWEDGTVVPLIVGLVPGIVLLLLAFCTRESIGLGDGLVFCMIGAGCGLKKTVAILGVSLLLSALLAMVLLVTGKAGRKTELPFLPCVFAGYFISFVL